MARLPRQTVLLYQAIGLLLVILFIVLLLPGKPTAQIQAAAVQATVPPAASATATPTPTVTHTPIPSLTPAPAPTLTPTLPAGEPAVIGYSVQGRALEVYRFGSGPVHQMIIAGIHGGYEANTVKLAEELIAYLKENPTAVPDDRTLFILPVLNPDGYHRRWGYEGRANGNGVDLNCNWDSNWQAEWPTAYCWSALPITAGSEPMSEPETQALAQFLLDYKIESLISYHSAGPAVFAGGKPGEGPAADLAKTLARAASYPEMTGESLCVFTGMLANWAVDHGIPAVDIELPDHAYPDFQTNLKALQAFLSWSR
ncbi:MAG: hypothetical protein GX491_01330 [Chloroflexi bacterium]|nr:hypothetical protein [Chloroflexota bacterium]